MDQLAASGNSPWVPGGVRRRRNGMILVGAILFLFLASGGVFLWFGMCVGRGWAAWTIASVGMAAGWGLPLYFFAVMLQRRLTKGRWLLTVQERRENYLRNAEKPKSPMMRWLESPWSEGASAVILLIPLVSLALNWLKRGRLRPFEIFLCAVWLSLALLQAWGAVRKVRQRRALSHVDGA